MKNLNISMIDKKLVNFLEVGLTSMSNNKCRYISFPFLSDSKIGFKYPFSGRTTWQVAGGAAAVAGVLGQGFRTVGT